jgi:FAD/FMN-containing dehydrogenase
VLAEVDGSREQIGSSPPSFPRLGQDALALVRPVSRTEIAALWRWRDGSIAAQVPRGGKVSEDIVVPLDRLAEAVEGTLEIGRRHGLPASSWGHAGDGNIHSTFLVSPVDEDELVRAAEAASDLFELAVRLGGSVSGEHGIGLVKRGQLARQWAPRALELHRAVEQAFDPKRLLNPGRKAKAALGSTSGMTEPPWVSWRLSYQVAAVPPRPASAP